MFTFPNVFHGFGLDADWNSFEKRISTTCRVQGLRMNRYYNCVKVWSLLRSPSMLCQYGANVHRAVQSTIAPSLGPLESQDPLEIQANL